MNRTDCYGGYYAKDGKTETTTHKRGLTPAVLRQHFRATCTDDVIGLHSAGDSEGATLSGTMRVDLDFHDATDDVDANQRAATAWSGVLVGLGFHPLLIDSNGKGGLWLEVVFDGPILALHSRQLGRWLTRNWGRARIDQAAGDFPETNRA